MITFELLHGYTKAKRMTVRQKMANLELNIEFVIRVESFTLEQTQRVMYSHLIGWGYVTACTCVEPCNYPLNH